MIPRSVTVNLVQVQGVSYVPHGARQQQAGNSQGSLSSEDGPKDVIAEASKVACLFGPSMLQASGMVAVVAAPKPAASQRPWHVSTAGLSTICSTAVRILLKGVIKVTQSCGLMWASHGSIGSSAASKAHASITQAEWPSLAVDRLCKRRTLPAA